MLHRLRQGGNLPSSGTVPLVGVAVEPAVEGHGSQIEDREPSLINRPTSRNLTQHLISGCPQPLHQALVLRPWPGFVARGLIAAGGRTCLWAHLNSLAATPTLPSKAKNPSARGRSVEPWREEPSREDGVTEEGKGLSGMSLSGRAHRLRTSGLPWP